MKASDYIDPDTNFPNSKVRIILNTLKPALMLALDKALKLLPEKYIVNSLDKCNSTEMKRQYLAFERGIAKWQKQKYVDNNGRPERSLRIMQKVFFTILSVEAHYLVLSAFILDEYRKIRDKKEDVEGITQSNQRE